MKTIYRILFSINVFFGFTYGAYIVGKYVDEHWETHFIGESEPGIGILWLYGIFSIAIIGILIFISYQASKAIIK